MSFASPKGPSPRTRGAADHGVVRVPLAGNSLARAGSSRVARAGFRRSWDHPREHGEQGSRLHPTTCRAHPRACGKQYAIAPQRRIELGPSPRTRGTVVRPLGGIIPAHVGNSRWGRGHRRSRRDHPRACGEQHPGRDRERPAGGTIPRARGAAPRAGRFPVGRGTIPGRAGSSDSSTPCKWHCRVHPHTRGEQQVLDHLPCGRPWPCGEQSHGRQGVLTPRGTIPAYAGSRSCCGA